MKRKPYPSDLTNEEWTILAPLIPSAKSGGRPRSANMREVLMVVVSAASVPERAKAKLVLAKIKGLFPRLHLIWFDGGYDGQDFIQWVKDTCQLVWKIIKREKQQHWLPSLALALDSRAHLRKRWDATDA